MKQKSHKAGSDEGAESALAASDARAATENSSPYTVTGTVTSPDRGGVGGLRVEVVDKNAGANADVLLAGTETDARGRYQVSFSAPPGKAQPDLQVRVFLKEKPKKPLAASEVRYNASSQETLDVQLLPGSRDLPSEYEALTGALGAHYKGKLCELQEADGRQDITYLVNKSGKDVQTVTMVAAADRLGSQAAVHPAFYYALLRAGLPVDAETLHQTDLATVRDVWKLAFEQGIIPKKLEEEETGAEEAFQHLAATQILDSRAVAGTSTLKEMLQLTVANPKQQRRFADLYVRHRGDLSTFWKEAAKPQAEGGLGPNVARRLQIDGQLGLLTLNNAPLMNSLRTGISSPVDLVKGGYHRAETWKPLLKDSPVPEQIPGNTPEEKRANYAESMAAQVRLSFPTAVIAEGIKRDEIKMPAGVKEKVVEFLTQQQGRLQIGAQPVDEFLASQSLARGSQTPDPQVVEQVQRLERVYQITPNDQAMAGLLNEDIDSSYKIVRYEEEEFVRLYVKDHPGAEAEARLIYAKAKQVHNTVLNVAVSYLLARNAPGLGLTPDASVILPAAAPPTGSDVKAYPTLETLFGAMDFCACEHCRSVLSPAAYLVDLLQFLNHSEEGEGNPQKVLLERRPDIQHLPLTCENTNQQVPYIDLVNETLEHFVAHDSLRDYQGHDTGAGASPEELLASPQFVEERAYDKLKEALFPAPLPFHKPLETLRSLFGKLAVPLHEAMEAVRKDDALERPSPAGYGWRDILMERLALSRGEYRLLTDRTLTVQQIYGLPSTADPLKELAKAKIFARRIGITYEEAVDLLETQLVRRLGPIVLADSSGGADLHSFDALEFRILKPDASTAPLRMYHYVGLLRFIRLWKKLGLAIDRTDQLIMALYPAAALPAGGDDTAELERLDRGFLALLPRIGVTFQVMECLKLSPERDLQELLACWSPLAAGGTSATQGWLARNLRMSVVELQSLVRSTGLDPFAAPDPPNPPMARFLDLMESLRDAGLKPVQALYLIWNEDISGKSVPDDRLIADLARSLGAGFAAVESELALANDPDAKKERKRQQAVATASAALRIDPVFTQAMLTDKEVFHAAADAAKPALDDLLALEPPAAATDAVLVGRLRSTAIRLLKVWSLASALKMTAREVVHFATRTEYRIDGKGWLNALVDAGRLGEPAAKALGDVLIVLLSFAGLKSELSSGDERLLSVLQNPDATLADGKSLLLSLTGWERASRDALLGCFGLTSAGLARVESFRRVHEACVLAKKLGAPASALVNAATNEPAAATVSALPTALRTRYDESGWLALIRPINDELRGLQRDALVTYILRKLAETADTRHIDTPDKLFEYFLTDVQMEPSMQTSRIRNAISSVQLFIERCLMNLETRVAPAVINAQQWEWMKRYRVWEANRKVFLWPENWLEPELRDDQSPFFKETMSELLQGDVNEDTAATALLNYLSKLEEIAKLQPCAFHYAENKTGTEDDVAYVVARTAGAHRKYYYRRREGVSWAPWEQIKLDIEDDPVIPVVWKGRLLLFWLKIFKRGPEALQVPGGGVKKPLGSLETTDISFTAPLVTQQAVLCWSEYYNGRWQPSKTSDVNQPVLLGQFQSEPSRSTFYLAASEEGNGEQLRIVIRAPYVQGSRQVVASFLLYNTHSLPVQMTAPFELPPDVRGDRHLVTDLPTLNFYVDYLLAPLQVLEKSVFICQTVPRTIPPRHSLQNAWAAPFFFEDGRHVFYVTTIERQREASGFGVPIQPASLKPAGLLAPAPTSMIVTPRPSLSGDPIQAK